MARVIGILKTYEVQEVLPLIEMGAGLVLCGRRFNVTDTMKLFKKSITCVICNRVGNKFVLESIQGENRPVLRLYAGWQESDEYAQHVSHRAGKFLTRDHIVPVSHGGKNSNNLQVMCSRCNNIKGDLLINNEQLKHIINICDMSTTKKQRRISIRKYIKEHNIQHKGYQR